MTEKLLIVFVKNPIPGKVKTRLAKQIGEQEACDVYKKLLQTTYSAVLNTSFDLRISYFESIGKEDNLWIGDRFNRTLQNGEDLGERMANDIDSAFKLGYKRVCLIGSDTFEITGEILEEAMKSLEEKEVVIGPAVDGGYYLIGFDKKVKDFRKVFKGITWSTKLVFEQTKSRLAEQGLSLYTLRSLKDIDTLQDLS